MSRLIDADSVMFTNFEIIACEGDYKRAFQLLCEKLDNAPTVDAVEVVRCRECKHLQKNGYCVRNSIWIGTQEDGGCDDFFCGDGDRKELKADDEPVKHAHWIELYKGNYKCSSCGAWWSNTVSDEIINYFNYCPDCGAKMDEVTE